MYNWRAGGHIRYDQVDYWHEILRSRIISADRIPWICAGRLRMTGLAIDVHSSHYNQLTHGSRQRISCIRYDQVDYWHEILRSRIISADRIPSICAGRLRMTGLAIDVHSSHYNHLNHSSRQKTSCIRYDQVDYWHEILRRGNHQMCAAG